MNGFGSNGSGSSKVDATKIGGLLPYDALTEYSNETPDYVEYQAKIWKYINVAPSTGNTPATPSDYWVEISGFELILPAANKAENELAATNGPAASLLKAVTPRGLYWWWEKLRTLPLTFTDTVTFAKAFFITAFAGVGERILVVDNTGKIINAYITADEFVAVPATLSSAGIPGQKAYAAPYLFYCIAINTWVKFLAEGSEYGIVEMYVAIPPTPTSPGAQGTRAYDETNSLMYEATANNKWIRWPVTKTW